MKDHLHEGHRERIDRKTEFYGLEFLEEHEQLERLLFAVIQRGDTNALAHRLLKEFKTIYGVLSADMEKLETVEGVGKRIARFLHDLLPMIGIAERSMLKANEKRVKLDTIQKAGDYAASLFYDKKVENFYMISLNSSFGVICFDKISEGSVTATEVSLNKIAKLAVRNRAYAVVLAHNHPGGRLEPSSEDIAWTDRIGKGLKDLDVYLAYHFVVVGKQWREVWS